MNNRLYLSGGGNEHQSYLLDRLFFESIPQNGSLLYIPIALTGSESRRAAGVWMRRVADLHCRRDIRLDLLDDTSGEQPAGFANPSAVYIGGGNVWSLMQDMDKSGLAKTLIRYVASGGNTYGGSAGAIIMGKRIDTSDDQNDAHWQPTEGLGLLGRYSVACHFINEDRKRYQIWADARKAPIICLPSESGLVIMNSVAMCVGGSSCVIHFPGREATIVAPNSSFSLR